MFCALRHKIQYRSSKVRPRYCGYVKGDSFAADAVWRPVPGRVPVCRREWCSSPATDETTQLCADHGGRAPEDDHKAKRTPRHALGAKKKATIIERPRAAQARRLPQPYSLVAPGPWEKEAACKDRPTSMFFADVTTYAKAVCATCPVKQQCLQFALEVNERFGVWGGKTERERAALRRKRRKEAA